MRIALKLNCINAVQKNRSSARMMSYIIYMEILDSCDESINAIPSLRIFFIEDNDSTKYFYM